jgi:hypothetical protein
VARPRQGRATGFRTIIVHKVAERALFVHLFSKSSKANLTAQEEGAFREAAKVLAALGDEPVRALLAAGEWIEVDDAGHAETLP